MTAMSASDQIPGKRYLPLMEHFAFELPLHPLKSSPVHEWLELAGVPGPVVSHFTDVNPVLKHIVQRGFGERGRFVSVDDTLPCERVAKHFKRQRLVGEQLKDAFDLGGVDRIMLDYAAAIDPHRAIA